MMLMSQAAPTRDDIDEFTRAAMNNDCETVKAMITNYEIINEKDSVSNYIPQAQPTLTIGPV